MSVKCIIFIYMVMAQVILSHLDNECVKYFRNDTTLKGDKDKHLLTHS